MVDAHLKRRPDFGPNLARGATECPRMLGPERLLRVRVIVQEDQFSSPTHPHGVAGTEHEAQRGAQTVWPGILRPERSIGPVLIVTKFGELALLWEFIKLNQRHLTKASLLKESLSSISCWGSECSQTFWQSKLKDCKPRVLPAIGGTAPLLHQLCVAIRKTPVRLKQLLSLRDGTRRPCDNRNAMSFWMRDR